MVSEVEGELRDGVGDADLLRATFPPGSVTGAPKLAALDVIAELESTGREAYTGRDRLRQPARRARAERRDPHVRGPRRRGSGSARAAGSWPTRRGRTRRARRRPRPRRCSPRSAPARRPPRPAAPPRRASRAAARAPCRAPTRPPGLYETLLVRAGEPQDLAAHLARLAASLRALYGLAPPPALAERARAAAAGHERARLRIDVVPGADAALVVTPAAPARAGRAAARRRPRRPRPAQVARPHAARGARGRRPRHAAAAARRRRRRARDEPDQRRGDRRRRHAPHAAGRRPHPARRHRGGQRRAPAPADARTTCAPRDAL